MRSLTPLINCHRHLSKPRLIPQACLAAGTLGEFHELAPKIEADALYLLFYESYSSLWIHGIFVSLLLIDLKLTKQVQEKIASHPWVS